jgi:hypothetical protein
MILPNPKIFLIMPDAFAIFKIKILGQNLRMNIMNFDAESKGQVDLACILMMVNSEVYSDDYNALKLAAILIIFGMAFSLDSRLYQLMVIKIAFAFSRDDDLHMTTDPLKDFSYNK